MIFSPVHLKHRGDHLKRRISGAVAAALLLFAPAQNAGAQGLIDLVPRAEITDANGVDMTRSVYRHHETLLRIGGGPHPLALTLNITSPGLVQGGFVCTPLTGDLGNAVYLALDSHAYFGNTLMSPDYTAVLPHQSAKFGMLGHGTSWTIYPDDAGYVTLAFDPTFTYLNYVGTDGTEAAFSMLHNAQSGAQGVAIWGAAEQIKFPDGETWTYRYNDIQYSGPTSYNCGRVSRVRSIVSSRGYALQFDYAGNGTGNPTTVDALRLWMSPVRVTAYSKAAVYCDETALLSCASVTALNSAVTFTYDRLAYGGAVTVSEPNGEQVTLTLSLNGYSSTLDLTNITRPGGVTRTMSYETNAYPPNSEQVEVPYHYLSSLTEAGRTWTYLYHIPGYGTYESSTEAHDPAGATTTYLMNGDRPYLITDPLGRQTPVAYYDDMRLGWIHYPGGNQVTADYDARRNLNLVQRVPIAGTGSTLQASAAYPSACTATDRRSCNRPTSVTDWGGNTTDYTYSPDHGGVLTETGPAVNQIRPQTRQEYAQRHAWILASGGGYVQAATPIWVPTAISTCRTSAATGNPTAPCAVAGDEVRTAYDYGPDGGPNTLLLRGQTVTATDNGVTTTLRTCYGYDPLGRRISETQPRAGFGGCPCPGSPSFSLSRSWRCRRPSSRRRARRFSRAALATMPWVM